MENTAYHPAQPSRTSGLAIASLIVSIVGCGWLSLVAVILGHLARGQIRRERGLQGAGLALAGLILGYLGIVCLAAIIFLGTLGGIALPGLKGAAQQAVVTMNVSSARMISLGAAQYETDKGKAPGSLEELVPDYLPEAVLYRDPETREELPFEYFTDRASIPFVLAAPRPFRGRRIVVRQDGSVGEIPEFEFLDRAGRAPH